MHGWWVWPELFSVEKLNILFSQLMSYFLILASLNTFSGNMTSASSGTKTSKDDCYVAMVTCPNVDTAKLLSRY